MEDNNKIYSSAILSDCNKYRYVLTRMWDESKPLVMFIMLNPSTADHSKDDPTIRRCIGFAKSWGYGGIIVCNLFAYRATNPKELLTVDNPFGDQNAYLLREMLNEVSIVVCAWGNGTIIKKILKDKSPIDVGGYIDTDKLHYIELSKDGIPKHPLYLKKYLTPKLYIK